MNPNDNIHIVLVEPQNPLNLGMTVRAMKNMAFNNCHLIKPAFTDLSKTQITAHRTNDLIENIHIHNSIDECLKNFHRAYAFSARQRTQSWDYTSLQNEAPNIVEYAKKGEFIALLFGREQTGLTNDELQRCNKIITIETNPLYSSLNLAQAVLVTVYSLFLQNNLHTPINRSKPIELPANLGQNTLLLKKIADTLQKIGYFKSNTPANAIHRIKNIFDRAQLTNNEINLLIGVFDEINAYESLLKRNIQPATNPHPHPFDIIDK